MLHAQAIVLKKKMKLALTIQLTVAASIVLMDARAKLDGQGYSPMQP